MASLVSSTKYLRKDEYRLVADSFKTYKTGHLPSHSRGPVLLWYQNHKDITKNYRPTFLLNIHVKILNKIPAN